MLEIIGENKGFGGRPNETLNFDYGVISNEGRNALVRHMNSSLDANVASGHNISVRRALGRTEDAKEVQG